MSRPANKTLIGIFVLGAIGLAVVTVAVLGSGKFFTRTYKAVCFFEESVGGLNEGAPVVFNGVRIGSVTDVVLRYDTRNSTTTIPVYIEIDPHRVETIGPGPGTFAHNLKILIDHGLKARLELQSIVTGQLQITLGSYPSRPAHFVGAHPSYPEIPTIPTPLTEITRKLEQLPLEEMIRNIATAVEGINRMVNSPETTQTVRSASQAVDEARGLIRNVNSRIEPLSSDMQKTLAELQRTLAEAQGVMRQVDAKTGTMTASMDEAVKDIRGLVKDVNGQVSPLGESVKRTMASLEKASDEAGTTLRRAQESLAALEADVGADSEMMYELRKTVKEVGSAVKAIQSLARSLEKQPESLLFGRKKKVGK